MKKQPYLAGDIGGTKTVLALFIPEDGPQQPFEENIFPSAAYSSLEEIVRKFLDEKGVEVSGASFGVAGPVFEGHSEITNLTWVVDSQSVSQEIGGAPTELLNDLYAIAQSIPYLAPTDLETLIPGEPV